jgi:tryptophan 2,3-dioxygenase
VATEPADEFGPILPGEGASDYERYLRTDELLRLQKRPDESAHRDELLFQTVHQTSELWLNLAAAEVEEAAERLRAREAGAAVRLLRRAVDCLKLVMTALDMLEHMSPWEYHDIRVVLGHGSGFDSPGFRRIREVSPRLGTAFHEFRRELGLSVVELIQLGREFEGLYQVEELMIEWDERLMVWRFRHLKVIERVLGGGTIGTQGTPVELLEGPIKRQLYPELWRARTELTELANAQRELP